MTPLWRQVAFVAGVAAVLVVQSSLPASAAPTASAGDCPTGHGLSHIKSIKGHCVCPQESPLCRGSMCSTAHRRGTGSAQVHGFTVGCDDCQCVPEDSSISSLPDDIHLEFFGEEGTMLVSWAVHKDAATHHDTEDTSVVLRADSTTPARTVKGSRRGQTSFYEALLGGLQASVQYEYHVTHGNSRSAWYKFRMPSTKPIEWTYAVVGDIGTKYSAPFVQHQLLHDNRLEGLIHPGDIGYVTSNEAFNEFLSGMAELVARVPYQVIAGNHEQLSEASFSSRWSTDEFASRSGSSSAFWFSYDMSGIHFVCISTEHDLKEGSDQGIWLRSALEKAAARKRSDFEHWPWIIVLQHRPLYSSFRRPDDQRQEHESRRDAIRSQVEQLYLEFGVDMVLCGHDHVYERSFPTFDSRRDENAPYLFTIGTGGHNVQERWYDRPETTAFRLAKPGYARLYVHEGEQRERIDLEFVAVHLEPHCKSWGFFGSPDCASQVLARTKGHVNISTAVVDRVTMVPRAPDGDAWLRQGANGAPDA